MKKPGYCFILRFVSVIMLLGCGDDDGVSSGTNTDMGTDADTGETDSGDTDFGDAGVMPTAFRVFNQTSTNRYISTWSPLRFQQHEGSVQTTRQFFPSSCQLLCIEVEKGSNCEIQCEPPLPAVRLIKPSESHIFDWDGFIYEANETHCAQGTC